ncbi:carbonic anhydrase [Hymenobacter arizonensis]|uniref:Carbonic anhydrase n=1 Tax=Hymenobacter arizonensis TaxID=1227077 RepID=A0A1I5ZNH1_HYMAR|nr:carbonic anhydrase [Hymenobacter arizonensis]SFQ57982.1 carbonic anhydrase [Hymenobacter arizonensis]
MSIITSSKNAPVRLTASSGTLLLGGLLALASCSQSSENRAGEAAQNQSTTEASQPGQNGAAAGSGKGTDSQFEAELSRMDPALAQAIRQGATMEEIAALRDPVATTPEQALEALKSGNARFFSGQAKRPGLSANERRAQILAQSPFAVVLGCSDSRVPIELVYDQGLGDMFVIRIAGNAVDLGTAGSVEYGVKHLKSHIVVVMGHEGCGAVKAAMLPAADKQQEPANVRYLLNLVSPSLTNMPNIRDPKAKKREAVVANVLYQKEQLKKNPVVAEAIRTGKIIVVGAYYDISSGAVDFYEDGAAKSTASIN